MSFTLHPQLAQDTLPIGDLPLCRLLLMNNAHFPWLILVPRRADKKELFDLEPADYKMLMDEVRFIAKQFSDFTQAHKINIATLGNQVPQLHMHIIARFTHDAAWPNPIWNCGVQAAPYAHAAETPFVDNLRNLFNITKM